MFVGGWGEIRVKKKIRRESLLSAWRAEITKGAEEARKRDAAVAENLPIETKKRFWVLMFEERKKLGEARKELDLPLMVASELLIQLHDTLNVPKKLEDIK